jgi:hypothetical protein
VSRRVSELPVLPTGPGPREAGREVPEADDPPPPEPIELNEAERELIGLELGEMGPVSSPQRKGAYDALAAAAVEGVVPPELVALLERVVAISLESGRARRRYLAEGEKVFTDLFRRTPSGQALQKSLRDVNKALEVLEGRAVEGVKVSLRTLGHIRISLETEGVSFTLAVRPSAVIVESLQVTGTGTS